MNDQQLLEMIKLCSSALFIIQSEQQKLEQVRELLQVQKTQSQLDVPVETRLIPDTASNKELEQYKAVVRDLAIQLIRTSDAPQTVQTFEINRIMSNPGYAAEIIRRVI